MGAPGYQIDINVIQSWAIGQNQKMLLLQKVEGTG